MVSADSKVIFVVFESSEIRFCWRLKLFTVSRNRQSFDERQVHGIELQVDSRLFKSTQQNNICDLGNQIFMTLPESTTLDFLHWKFLKLRQNGFLSQTRRTHAISCVCCERVHGHRFV